MRSNYEKFFTLCLFRLGQQSILKTDLPFSGFKKGLKVINFIYKNKIIFPFKLDLTMKLKHDGTVSKILVREKDIKKLVEILKPKRFFNQV